MTNTLKDYLTTIPCSKQLDKTYIEAYRQEMVDNVIPKNLRAAAEKKRLTSESRFRAAQVSAKRDLDD